MTMHIPGDDGGHFPDLATAKAYLHGNTQTNPEYHADRMRALGHLFAKIPMPRSVVDFGCGDGMYITEAFAGLDCVVGIDISAAMV
ncbi:hypothetical protein [uncultured Lamprocystis sp.]|jgi:trans-aconitate methyltransferase|uniref:hypothetical protein n=1 Tax=uncultured Lamprocystis sp. TaxID=543132 RepID=UPI0025FDAEA7|nr:hypothetical protein [uncultured Lamprocystis sp.]